MSTGNVNTKVAYNMQSRDTSGRSHLPAGMTASIRKEKAMDLSEKLRNARAAKRMSQTELANRTGMSLRTIQNYELGTRLPKSRSTYDKLAEALDMDVNILLDDSAEFVLRASEKYGGRGGKQAWDMVSDIKALWAGGEMEEEDMDEIMQALQEAYWEAKKNNRKYVNKRYRKEDSPSE